MNLTENILISNILIVKSLQLFIINMTVYAGLYHKRWNNNDDLELLTLNSGGGGGIWFPFSSFLTFHK